MRRISTALLLGVFITVGPAIQPAGADITVFAAASLTNALTEIAMRFETEGQTTVKLSFAASSALAKQIEQGAPADVFVSADSKWIEYLDGKGKIDHDSVRSLAGNDLVLIAPASKAFKVEMRKGFDFAKAFDGNLCTGVVESVPVGMYAKEALTHLDWWKAIQYRVVGTDDVRAALNLVEKGECLAGIVYATDAKQSGKVEVIGQFPDSSHAPIVYPAALVTEAGEAQAFMTFISQPAALEILDRFGFKRLR